MQQRGWTWKELHNLRRRNKTMKSSSHDDSPRRKKPKKKARREEDDSPRHKKPKKKARPKEEERESVEEEVKAERRLLNAQDVIDAGNEIMVTISTSAREVIAQDGTVKRVVYWEEDNVKPAVANKTNCRMLMSSISKFVDEWPGRHVRLTTGPTNMGPGIVFDVLDDNEVDEDDYDAEEDEEEDV